MRIDEQIKAANEQLAAGQAGYKGRTGRTIIGARADSGVVEAMMRLPQMKVSNVQVLDPLDADFGKFYWLEDYDPIL